MLVKLSLVKLSFRRVKLFGRLATRMVNIFDKQPFPAGRLSNCNQFPSRRDPERPGLDRRPSGRQIPRDLGAGTEVRRLVESSTPALTVRRETSLGTRSAPPAMGASKVNAARRC
jgi:hypothetical protein